jgi:pantoate--beta-alanine ligase
LLESANLLRNLPTILICRELEVFKNIAELQEYLKRSQGKSLGFVPTMGALHHGHMELIKASNSQSDITVCSIFVNPVQFNKKDDFDNYPNTLDTDLKMLELADCDVVFCPSAEEMYPTKVDKNFDFGPMAEVMEGEHRPGHFNGVAIVIERFFEIIDPDFAYFGEKDFQQLAVVRALTKMIQSKTKIIGVPTVRETSGLAMSSRNKRLNKEQLDAAKVISESLAFVANNKDKHSIDELSEQFYSNVNSSDYLEVEYFSIADGNTLEILKSWEESNYPIAFTAVMVGDVRLIDNMTIIN